MDTISLKNFKNTLKGVIGADNGEVSVCWQDTQNKVMGFAKLHGAKLSFRKSHVLLFVPGEVTFQIPYRRVEFSEAAKQFRSTASLEIMLTGGHLVSIRPL
jgi:hypothetical protein